MTSFRAAAIFCTALYLSGCALTGTPDSSGKFIVQYSTLKLIEQSSNFTKASVLDTIADLRARVINDEEVRYVDLKQRLMDETGYDELDPSDQLLMMALFDNLSENIEVGVGTEFITAEDRLKISTFFTWVEQAARMSR